ncbi:MAG TPA: helix-turn-helix domain-containing protein [Actinophytocola sp.]|uniref:winged helix-turn-helix transcriptional regulator n=1 Tax=Actinophytocola sp. TaxID=1872138 RepID=UPI002DDD4E12|nr:helix-turn-helix domain-containing protein [Actinophytocola sp.]HEV2778185.1 helix-turn-helix domain-containing protein [Actinophytocola sp.]
MLKPTALRYRPEDCSIARSLEVLGERWTILVLREAFSGVRRFDDIQQNTGAPRQVLSQRLAHLVEHGILRRVPYQEPGQRQRHEYRLTEKGLDLYPVLVGLLHWGDKYLADEGGPSVRLTHKDCGAPVRVTMLCADGHEIGSAREVRPVPLS